MEPKIFQQDDTAVCDTQAEYDALRFLMVYIDGYNLHPAHVGFVENAGAYGVIDSKFQWVGRCDGNFKLSKLLFKPAPHWATGVRKNNNYGFYWCNPVLKAALKFTDYPIFKAENGKLDHSDLLRETWENGRYDDVVIVSRDIPREFKPERYVEPISLQGRSISDYLKVGWTFDQLIEYNIFTTEQISKFKQQNSIDHITTAPTIETAIEVELGSTTERVIAELRDRHQAGLLKYGTTIDRDDLTADQWCQHAIEEGMDLIMYLSRLKQDMVALREDNAVLSQRVRLLKAQRTDEHIREENQSLHAENIKLNDENRRLDIENDNLSSESLSVYAENQNLAAENAALKVRLNELRDLFTWQEGEIRMEPIGQNGNTGEHYEAGTDTTEL